MTIKLKCIKEMKPFLTLGEIYEVDFETDECYVFTNDDDMEHWMPKEPDEKGESYKDWLIIYEG